MYLSLHLAQQSVRVIITLCVLLLIKTTFWYGRIYIFFSIIYKGLFRKVRHSYVKKPMKAPPTKCLNALFPEMPKSSRLNEIQVVSLVLFRTGKKKKWT